MTGRYKDMIIVNGQNIYPHDIERTAEEVEGVELGKIAACGVYNKERGEDDIVVFVVSKKMMLTSPRCPKAWKSIYSSVEAGKSQR